MPESARARSLQDAVEIWLVDPAQADDPALCAAYDALASPTEREKIYRYRFERDQHLCRVARALVRTTLSLYCPEVAPQDWRFSENEYGRPDVAPGQCELDIRFNLSHTHGLIACAVTVGRDVGVDVERRDRLTKPLEIADRFFSPHEVQALHRLPAHEQVDRFFRYWTLKESYIKARGMGLSLSLEAFSFEVERSDAIAISFVPPIEDDPQSWQFYAEDLGSNYALAAGVRRGLGSDLPIRVEWTVPLRTGVSQAAGLGL